jgi:hypothetical protein
MSTIKKGQWYVATALFESEVEGHVNSRRRLCEETLFLVSAGDLALARQKARKLARAKRESYRNKYGENVTWRFVRLLDVRETIDDRFEDGAEIIARFSRRKRQVERDPSK